MLSDDELVEQILLGNENAAEELKKRMMEVRERMYAAGAHYVVESIEELPALIDCINTRMANE